MVIDVDRWFGQTLSVQVINNTTGVKGWTVGLADLTDVDHLISDFWQDAATLGTTSIATNNVRPIAEPLWTLVAR